MSRPLPDCAHCGGSLSHCGRVLLRYGDLPGAPEVGWHTHCATADKAIFNRAASLLGTTKASGKKVKTLLHMIHKRGGRYLLQARVMSHLKMGEKGGYRRAYGSGLAFDI